MVSLHVAFVQYHLTGALRADAAAGTVCGVVQKFGVIKPHGTVCGNRDTDSAAAAFQILIFVVTGRRVVLYDAILQMRVFPQCQAAADFRGVIPHCAVFHYKYGVLVAVHVEYSAAFLLRFVSRKFNAVDRCRYIVHEKAAGYPGAVAVDRTARDIHRSVLINVDPAAVIGFAVRHRAVFH